MLRRETAVCLRKIIRTAGRSDEENSLWFSTKFISKPLLLVTRVHAVSITKKKTVTTVIIIYVPISRRKRPRLGFLNRSLFIKVTGGSAAPCTPTRSGDIRPHVYIKCV